jgi:hypothetical protein
MILAITVLPGVSFLEHATHRARASYPHHLHERLNSLALLQVTGTFPGLEHTPKVVLVWVLVVDLLGCYSKRTLWMKRLQLLPDLTNGDRSNALRRRRAAAGRDCVANKLARYEPTRALVDSPHSHRARSVVSPAPSGHADSQAELDGAIRDSKPCQGPSKFLAPS